MFMQINNSIRELWTKNLEIIFQKQIRKYWINIGGKSYLFNPGDLLRVESDGSYCHLITKTNRFHISHNLAHMEKQLSGWGFIRVSRGYIVNVTHIKQIISGRPCIILQTDGFEIKLPRRTGKKLIRKFEEIY